MYGDTYPGPTVLGLCSRVWEFCNSVWTGALVSEQHPANRSPPGIATTAPALPGMGAYEYPLSSPRSGVSGEPVGKFH